MVPSALAETLGTGSDVLDFQRFVGFSQPGLRFRTAGTPFFRACPGYQGNDARPPLTAPALGRKRCTLVSLTCSTCPYESSPQSITIWSLQRCIELPPCLPDTLDSARHHIFQPLFQPVVDGVGGGRARCRRNRRVHPNFMVPFVKKCIQRPHLPSFQCSQ